jgi:hypothetical protein
LAAVERQLDQAIDQWRVAAVACQLLNAVRHEYETERQPETLREASGYLDSLTGGRYRRVWTPLAERTLRVDDAEGNWLSVEVLSRGTREQLFLALRLAIAALYARRGAMLPLVLDDVLVNFDVDRAKRAAKVLRDFAKQGVQILLFTCHEHIEKIFKSLKTDVRRLPGIESVHAETIAIEPLPAKRKKSVAIVEPVEEIEEEIEVEEEEVETILEVEDIEDEIDDEVEEEVEDEYEEEDEDDEETEEEVDEYEEEEEEEEEVEEESSAPEDEDWWDEDEDDEYEDEAHAA